MKALQIISIILVSLVCNIDAKERVLGTPIAIDPPTDFEKAKQFPGYVMKSNGSSVMVTTIPGPFSEVSKGFTAEGLATKKMKLISKEDYNVGTNKGLLIHVSQKARGSEYLKWISVFGNEAGSAFVVASFPKDLEEELSTDLKKSVLSAEWLESIELDIYEGLTFRVSEFGPFKMVKKMGNMVVLAPGDIFPPENPSDPVVIVGSSISEDWKIQSDIKNFSHLRLKQNKELKALNVIEESEIVIGGLDGYLICAKGPSKKDDGELYIEQCIMFTDDGYYIFQALAEYEKKDQFKDDFRKILQSFKVN